MAKHRGLDLYVVPVGTGLQWKDATGLSATCAHVGPQNPALSKECLASALSERRWRILPCSLRRVMGTSSGRRASKSWEPLLAVSHPRAGAPLGNQVPVLSGGVGETCEEAVYVDIYIDSMYYTTLDFNAGHTKWWYVGYFSVQPASMEYPEGSTTWVTESRVVHLYDPVDCVASPQVALTFNIEDAGEYTAETDLSDLRYTVMRMEYQGGPSDADLVARDECPAKLVRQCADFVCLPEEQACEANTLCGRTCERCFCKWAWRCASRAWRRSRTA